MRDLEPDFTTTFVGRQDELDHVEQQVRRGVRLITLWGEPGIGKTRLATEFSRRSEDRFPGGRAWVRCHALRSAGDLLHVLARTTGIPADAHTSPHRFAQRLSNREHSLVVLDNLDVPLGPVTDLLLDIVELAEGTVFLVTRRGPLALPLELSAEVGPMGQDDAIDLFFDRARQGYGAERPDESAVAQIVDRLGCSPYPVELVARAAGTLGMAHLAAQETWGGSVEEVLDWAWRALPPEPRHALEQCICFARPFNREAAAEVLELPTGLLSTLSELVDHGWLIARTDGSFEVPSPAREFVRRMGDPDTVARGVERHRRHFAAHAERIAEMFNGPNAHETLQHADPLADDVYRLLSTEPRSDAEWLVSAQTAVAIRELWHHYGPADRYLEIVTTLAERDSQDVVVAQLLLAAGISQRLLGDVGAAAENLKRALTLVETQPARVRVLNELGVLHHQLRQTDKARSYYEQALADGPDEVMFEARVIGNLGALAHDVGEFDEALAYYEDSLKALRRARETRVEAVFLTNLGLLRQELGAFDEAIEDFSVALDLLNRTPDPRLEAVARTNRGMLFLALDDRVKAQADQEAAVRLFSESADHREMALASIRLGATQALAGDRFGARRAIDAAERVLGPSDDALAIELVELGRAFMDLQLAVSAHQLGDSDDTVRHLGVAERKLLAALNEENAALFDVFFDARILASLLRTRIEALGAHGEEDALIVAADAQRFRPPGGSWQDFGRKQSAKGILAALVSRHGSSPVEPLTVDDLFRAGWGDQNIQNDSKANRVYVALSDLRKKGLRTLIRRTEAGYFLDPSVPVVRVDR